MTPRPLKTRFAPSPTGLLHLGNVRTALFNYLLALGAGGVFLLRIEDSDAARGHEQYRRALIEDLRWLGLDWDEGPERGGASGPYAQSERAGIYSEYLAALEAAGRAYPCFCTERELEVERKTQIAAGRPPRYSGKCRALSAREVAERRAQGMSAVLRFRVPDARDVVFVDRVRGPQRFATADIGDFVIRRSDGSPAFFFCNAVDDALMGVTLVVRGDDHLANTPRQLLLLEALGLDAPDYAHIPLVVGPNGAPLSKRSGSRSLAELRAAGYLPAAINNYLARVGHTYDEQRLLSLAELAGAFRLERVHRSPARYDEAQLRYWQREAVRALPADRLWDWMRPAAGALVPPADREAFVEAVRANVTFPEDVARWARVIYTDEIALSRKAREVIGGAGPEFFEHSLAAAAALERPAFEPLAARTGELTGRKGKSLFQPLRSALTGEPEGPEMAKLVPLIGLDRVQARLRRAAAAARAGAPA
ncbi:MAG TPA: glutamate--tRNA ligase [Burkholderiales bacterium]